MPESVSIRSSGVPIVPVAPVSRSTDLSLPLFAAG